MMRAYKTYVILYLSLSHMSFTSNRSYAEHNGMLECCRV
jgi:hypothetical protein